MGVLVIKPKFSVLIPAYNEQKSIEKTLAAVKQTMKPLGSYEIIVINDGSRDMTARLLSEIKGITTINSPYNMGYGASLKKGLKKAEGELIIITDADGTYPIEDIPRLAKYIGKYSMVVGARTGKNVHVPLLRKPAKFLLGQLANFLAGRKIPDINSGLRIFKKDIAMEFFHLYPSGFSFTTTITLACLTNNYAVKYIPINYYKRKGKSSISPFDFFNFISLMFRIIMYFNPMKVLTPFSLFFLLLGVIRGIRDFYLTNALGTLTLMLFLMAIQIFILGIIADIIIKSKTGKA